jgi:serine protease Do
MRSSRADAVPRVPAFRSEDSSLLGVVDSVHASIVTVVGYPPAEAPLKNGAKPRRLIGTGIALSDDRIITPASIARPGGVVRVYVDAGVEHTARLLGLDRQSNLALFQVEGAKLRGLKSAPPQSLAVGSWVAVVSNVTITRPQAALGRIIGRGERIDFAHPGGEILEIDAPSYPGSTGGAVLNEDGDWVAVVVGRAAPTMSDGSRVGFQRNEALPDPGSVLIALPVEQVSWITKELDAYGSVRHGFLGIQLRRAPPAPGDSLGVLVASVIAGSPADSAGFHAGDRILAIEGQEVHTADELTAMVRALRPGDDIEVTVLRRSEIFPIHATVGAAFSGPPVGPNAPDSVRLREMREELRQLDLEKRKLEEQIRSMETQPER